MASRSANLLDKLLHTAFVIIERDGWRDLSMLSLAKASKIKVSELYSLAPDKQSLLRLLLSEFDRAIVEGLGEPDPRTSARDRIFDAILNAFEAMTPRKEAMRVLYHDLRGDPGTWPAAWSGLKKTSQWVADSAGVDTRGLLGALRLRGLSLLLTDTTPIWLDDGEDLGRTMSHVDKRLRRLENTLSLFRRKPKDGEHAAARTPETNEDTQHGQEVD